MNQIESIKVSMRLIGTQQGPSWLLDMGNVCIVDGDPVQKLDVLYGTFLPEILKHQNLGYFYLLKHVLCQ